MTSARAGRLMAPLAGLLVVAVALAVYWPVGHANFVWDDFIFVHDAAWVRDNAGWLDGIFEPFSDAKNYFRPLGMAAFALETRLSGASSRWMHFTSLFLHLANVMLVGLLAAQLRAKAAPAEPRRTFAVALAMAIFALHPLLVEPVAWISNQFELIATFFILAGVVAHLAIERTWLRVIAVAALFFLGACAKETAVALPILLLVVDWLRAAPTATSRDAFAGVRRQWPVYAAILVAGIGYLALRRWSFGHLLASAMTEPLELASRLQLVCFTYLTYWKVLFWPMQGLGPLHIAAPGRFDEFSALSSLVDAAALGIIGFGAWQLWKRRPVGALIVSVTAALFPVLHVLPINFDDSYYHDRFATLPLALACAYLPLVGADWGRRFARAARLAPAAHALALLWLMVAIANVRVTLPLWSDEELLWLWVLRDNPHLPMAQTNLLALYIDRGDLAKARVIAQQVKQDASDCFNCMIDVAQLAATDQDADGLEHALDAAGKAYRSRRENIFPREVAQYIILTGDLRRLRGDDAGAEAAYRDAIATAPDVPATHINLALALAHRGRIEEARAAAEAGFVLLPSAERQRSREAFERRLREAGSRALRPAGGSG